MRPPPAGGRRAIASSIRTPSGIPEDIRLRPEHGVEPVRLVGVVRMSYRKTCRRRSRNDFLFARSCCLPTPGDSAEAYKAGSGAYLAATTCSTRPVPGQHGQDFSNVLGADNLLIVGGSARSGTTCRTKQDEVRYGRASCGGMLEPVIRREHSGHRGQHVLTHACRRAIPVPAARCTTRARAVARTTGYYRYAWGYRLPCPRLT